VGWGQFKHRRPSDREICRMFALDGVGGLGVVAGGISGGPECSLVIRDFDTQLGYERWRAANRRLANEAPTVRTRRGHHVYCRVRGPVTWLKLAEGELIADGGHFAVLPPSIHPKGGVYHWVPYPPLGISDFPVLSLEATGFVSGGVAALRQVEEEDGLCPILGFRDLSDLSNENRETIFRTLPERPGERNSKLFLLARSLRDLFPASTPPGELEPAVRQWWQSALPVIGTKDWRTTWNDFRRAWSRASVPVSHSRPIVAMTCAARAVSGAGSSPKEIVLAACNAVAGLQPGGVFHLSCRTAAQVTGLSKSTANTALNQLVQERKLTIVQPALRGASARRACFYRLYRAEEFRNCP
jgi:hypothetical protein